MSRLPETVQSLFAVFISSVVDCYIRKKYFTTNYEWPFHTFNHVWLLNVGNNRFILKLLWQVAYDTCAYRKQHHQQTTLLPIGDPAVLWRQTVCLNTIVHRLQYTLTVAVCARVPRKSTATGINDVYDSEEFELHDPEYDLQLLSRHVHVSSRSYY